MIYIYKTLSILKNISKYSYYILFKVFFNYLRRIVTLLKFKEPKANLYFYHY